MSCFVPIGLLFGLVVVELSFLLVSMNSGFLLFHCSIIVRFSVKKGELGNKNHHLNSQGALRINMIIPEMQFFFHVFHYHEVVRQGMISC